MWNFDKAKYVFTLDEKWPYQDKLKDLCNKKIMASRAMWVFNQCHDKTFFGGR